MKGDEPQKIFSSELIYRAYLDCRRRKRGTANALRFEMHLLENLLGIEEELNSGTYRPSRSVCFVNERPKPREIFAADFRDRVVHHLFVREIEPYWEKVFVHDSYASRRGKGTHGAVDRLGSFVRKVTRGGRRRAWYLQIDVANFFMTIDKNILFELIDRGLRRQLDVPARRLPLFCKNYEKYLALRGLASALIFHDPTEDYVRKSPKRKWQLLAQHKSLFNQPKGKGLPIGNLTSQFFANVYLNELDQFAKHALKAQYYIRYVDDLILLSDDRDALLKSAGQIEDFLRHTLLLETNKKAFKLASVSSGINFLGYVTHPAYRLVRRRIAGNLKRRLSSFENELIEHKSGLTIYNYRHQVLEELLAVLNSYLAHTGRASSYNLLYNILGEHDWLWRYFTREETKVVRLWQPPNKFERLREQVSWFRQHFEEAVIFFQIGNYYELFGKDANWANKNLGLKLIEPRFGRESRAGVPGPLVQQCVDAAVSAGSAALRVDQTGYPLARINERSPAKLWRR